MDQYRERRIKKGENKKMTNLMIKRLTLLTTRVKRIVRKEARAKENEKIRTRIVGAGSFLLSVPLGVMSFRNSLSGCP